MSDVHLKESLLERESVFDGVLLKVYRDHVRLPNGQAAVRELIRHPGAVVVIPVLASGKLVFERQFRYPVGEVFLELPAGKIDAGEDMLLTAQRELREETGCAAAEWHYLGRMHPCIGYSDERIEIFLARDVQQVAGQALDHNEFLDVMELSLAEAMDNVRRGVLTDAKTITALFWAEKVLSGTWSLPEVGQD